MSDLSKIVEMFKDDAVEKRAAAAIVLAELRPKDAAVVSALMRVASDDPMPVVQRHALTALAQCKVAAKKLVPIVLPLLNHRDADVKRAAVLAIVGTGEEAISYIRERLSSLDKKAEERRLLDEILAELGGRDALSTLLVSLTAGDATTAKAAALSVRHTVKNADNKTKRAYASEIQRFLSRHEKDAAPDAAVAAALKILGYLDDEKTVPILVRHASDTKLPTDVRTEAIIALRAFAQNEAHASAIAEALIDAAVGDDRAIAHTALHTLGGLRLAARDQKRLEALLFHRDIERSVFVIEHLARQGDAVACEILSDVLNRGDKRRAEMAASALETKAEAAPFLARVLLGQQDSDRAWLIRKALQKHAENLSSTLKKQLVAEAVRRIDAHESAWEALFEVAKKADPKQTSDALHTLVLKLKKGKDSEKTARILALIQKSGLANADDTFGLAALQLFKSSCDVRPSAREQDEALKTIASLLRDGFDVKARLTKEKSLDLSKLYYVGFHFFEEGEPLGAELLSYVVEKAGRTKLAKMAKNKLALAVTA